MTQQELADKAGIHRVALAKLEGGTNSPSWETVVKLCEALGVSCEVFR